MTTYYVRKTGLDSNDGQSAGAAWLTIDKAANTVSAGDTVYVGAGVYRELVTMDTAGSSGSPIQYIADLDGSQTGDAGLVIVSAHDSDTGSAQRAACWSFAAALDPIYITIRGFTMQGGTTATIDHGSASGDNSYEGLIIEDCAIYTGLDTGDDGIFLNYNEGAVPTGNGLRIRRCMLFSTRANASAVELRWDENATAERDIDALIENCVMMGGDYAIWWNRITASTYDLVGLSIYNCSFLFLDGAGVFIDDGSSTSTPIEVYNCVFWSGSTGIYGTTTSGMATSDYNTFVGVATPYTNVTQGSNDRTQTDATEVPPVLLGGIADFPLRAKLGWSPWLPWEPIELQDHTAMTQSVIGDADATYAPADDLYGNDRPMGPGADNADDRGAVEARARPEQETTTVRTGSNAIRFEGAGYHDFLVPVAAQSTTITIYGRYDASYTGTKPSMTISNDDLMTEVTDTMTGAANNWEQLTSGAFTPSAAGIVRVRVKSSDTSSGGQCFFDDLVVS